MSNTELIIMYVVLGILLILSFFFSGVENVYPTVNRLRLKKDVKNNKKYSKTALKFASDYNKVAPTALFGNALVNIASSAIVTLLGMHYGGEKGAAIAAAILFVVILVFCEITPKILCLKFNYHLSYAFLPLTVFFYYLFFPVTFLVNGLIKLIMKPVNKKKDKTQVDKDVYSEDELQEMVNEIEESGLIDEDKSELIKSAIDFSDTEAYEIMTPRIDVFAIDIEDDIYTLMKEEEDIFKYSHVPVYEDTIDNVIGILPTKLLLRLVLSESKFDLKSLLIPAYFVHHSKNIPSLLDDFKRERIHIAIVIDEYGGTEGIITTEDIIEEIVGEIWDEQDEVNEPVIKLSDDHYEVDGSYNLEDFFELLDIKEDEETDYDTVSGWCLDILDRFAEVGDTFDYEGYRIVVTKTDKFTVEKIEVSKIISNEEDN
ncbi:MAG: hemolysin family protein [Bacilli bacterium]|jgi:putative hemolysin